MNNPNTMSQQRPPFEHRPPSHISMPPQFQPSQMINGQARSPSQHQFSPQMSPLGSLQTNSMNGMGRMSPGGQSPYSSHYPPPHQQIRPPQVSSPVDGNQANGYPSASVPPARTGSMGPPSLPVNKPTDLGSLQDSLAGTGVNIEEEDRRLTHSDFYGHPTPNSSFNSPRNSFGPYSGGGPGRNGSQQGPQLSEEEIQKRKEIDASWDAARREQHPLWEMFLYGESLSQRLKRQCADQNINAPQNGLYIASAGHPYQMTRVNGLDGASRVVEKGEPILKTGEGDALGDVLKAICLGAKERLTGLIDLSGRLALERRQHSAGKVPTEWKPLAIVSAPSPGAADTARNPASGTSRKRTFSEANRDSEPVAGPHPVVDVFRSLSSSERKAEAARLAKRAKRNASKAPDFEQTAGMLTPGAADTPGAMSLDSEKRVTKKDRKAAESKFSEAQQHKSANETARMATSGLLGGKFGPGKTKKTYSWLSGGGTPGGSTAISTPTRPAPASAGTSAAATPTGNRPAAAQPAKMLGQWDEEKELGIQARDLLLVLETDGKAQRSLLRGYNVPDG